VKDFQNGKIVFQRGSCDEVLETGAGPSNSSDVMACLRREGWGAHQVGHDRIHGCPKHTGIRRISPRHPRSSLPALLWRRGPPYAASSSTSTAVAFPMMTSKPATAPIATTSASLSKKRSRRTSYEKQIRLYQEWIKCLHHEDAIVIPSHVDGASPDRDLIGAVSHDARCDAPRSGCPQQQDK
jgi:hypothetical protein